MSNNRTDVTEHAVRNGTASLDPVKLSEDRNVAEVFDREIKFCLSAIIADQIYAAGGYRKTEKENVIRLLLEKHSPLISSFLLDN